MLRKVLTERFIARVADGIRPTGHADPSRVDEFLRTLTKDPQSLRLGKTMSVIAADAGLLT